MHHTSGGMIAVGDGNGSSSDDSVTNDDVGDDGVGVTNDDDDDDCDGAMDDDVDYDDGNGTMGDDNNDDDDGNGTTGNDKDDEDDEYDDDDDDNVQSVGVKTKNISLLVVILLPLTEQSPFKLCKFVGSNFKTDMQSQTVSQKLSILRVLTKYYHIPIFQDIPVPTYI